VLGLPSRNDVLREVLVSAYTIGHPVAIVLANYAISKVVFQCMQYSNVALMLDDSELGKDLESSCHFRVKVYAHVKAASAINKADDPLRIEFQRDLRDSTWSAEKVMPLETAGKTYKLRRFSNYAEYAAWWPGSWAGYSAESWSMILLSRRPRAQSSGRRIPRAA
jgi:hypothetical protein